MFTGIVQETVTIQSLEFNEQGLRYAVACPKKALKGLKQGASVSIDGVCQTVVSIEESLVWFDAIDETLKQTTLQFIRKGQTVNWERSAKMGNEIGSHFVSGHVWGIAPLIHIEENSYTFRSDKEWTPYLFQKGSITLDGVGLTLAHIDLKKKIFTVCLIPYTLATTTLAKKIVGDQVNIEIDSLTRVAVDTIKREVIRGPW